MSGRTPDLIRQSTTLPGDGPPSKAAEGTAAGTGFNTVAVADQKSATTEVAAVVQAKALEQFELLCGGVQGHAIGPCDRNAGQMSCPDAQYML